MKKQANKSKYNKKQKKGEERIEGKSVSWGIARGSAQLGFFGHLSLSFPTGLTRSILRSSMGRSIVCKGARVSVHVRNGR